MGDAEKRIRAALQDIEAAQNKLNDACSKLSPVVGMLEEWEQLGVEANRVKALWHKVHGVFLGRDEWRLDNEG